MRLFQYIAVGKAGYRLSAFGVRPPGILDGKLGQANLHNFTAQWNK